MANFPEISAKVVDAIDKDYPGFKDWHRDFKTFMRTTLNTLQDVTCLTAGKGIVLTNDAGTITKRVKLGDAGNDIEIEAV